MKRFLPLLALLCAPLAFASFVILSPGVSLPGEDYTLASIGEIPFEYETPTAPTITSEDVATTTANFSSNNANGNQIVLAAGDYGNITLSGSDRELIITTGVTIGTLNVTGVRISVKAVPARSGIIEGNISVGESATDVLIDGVAGDSTATSGSRNSFTGQRVAVINSWLRAQDYSVGSFPNSIAPHNIIFANCLLEGTGSSQAGSRMRNSDNHIMVDSRVVKTGSTHNTWRVHSDAAGMPVDNMYVARNRFEGPRLIINTAGGAPTGSESDIGNVWFDENSFYMTTGGVAIETSFSFGQTHHIELLRARGNSFYGPSSVTADELEAWDISSNTFAAYESPPAWDFQ